MERTVYFSTLVILMMTFNQETVDAMTTTTGGTTTAGNPCVVSPCINNGLCIDNGDGSYSCNCPDGWGGTNCGNATNECTAGTHQCANGATCYSSGNSYECYCPPGYAGRYCEYIDYCIPVTCLNGGSCAITTSSYVCACRFGYSGQHCEYETCDNTPCRYGAKCTEDANRAFSCQCRNGYGGVRCQIKCHSKCRAASGCTTNGAGKCDGACVSGYELNPTTKKCRDKNECTADTDLCENGATCVNTVGSYRCRCAPGYVGRYCSEVDNCASTPCRNRGSCKSLANANYKCKCRNGFGGNTCAMKCDRNCISGCNRYGTGKCDRRCAYTHKLIRNKTCRNKRCNNIKYKRRNRRECRPVRG